MDAVESAIDAELNGFGPTIWEPDVAGSACIVNSNYQPVDDGTYGAQSDAFDDGLMLRVNGVEFEDPDGFGDLQGESLTVGPVTVDGVRISRTDRALQTSPTMQSLIKLKNTRNHGRRVRILWDSDLGSNGSTRIRATSNGNLIFSQADRWVVTSDSAVSPGDPPLTFVLFDKGRGVVRTIPEAGCNPATTQYLTVRMERFKISAHSTRYVLFFTEMNDTNARAINRAQKFNSVGSNSKLLAQIRSRILDRS